MVVLTDADKREIGQHFVLGIHGHEISEDAKTLIRDYHVGNIILMKRNVQSIKQVHALVKSLQQFAKDCGHAQPLMIGIDQENGLVSAFSRPGAGTQFPGAMALAATGDPEIAKACSLGTAKEMKLAGINWAYSPVADVNSDHRNPVIGVRSFGDDPQEVAKYAIAVKDGLTEGGIAACGKHFPGHGDTHVDSHLALPVIRKRRSELDGTELVPFRALIEAGVATIMTGHMALPLVEEEDDEKMPCSCSGTVTRKLLRDELGFGGVVVTDCLEMEAVASTYTTERGAVLSLCAGADVVMICHTLELQTGAIEATYKAVENGELSLGQLRESGGRIARLKGAFAGAWEGVVGDLDLEMVARVAEANATLSREAYDAAVVVIKGPVEDDGPGPVVVLTPEAESVNRAVDDALTDRHYAALVEGVRGRHRATAHFVYGPGEGLAAEVVAALNARPALVVFVTCNGRAWQLEYWARLRVLVGGTRAVVLASCGPYEGGRVSCGCVGCFEHTDGGLAAAVGVVLGERRATGRLPVRI